MRFLFSLFLVSAAIFPAFSLAATVAPPPPTCTLSVSPATIKSGSSSKFSWKTTNAGYLVINGVNVPAPDKNTPTTEFQTVSPKKTTTFSGYASGPGGTAGCNQVTLKVTTTSSPANTVGSGLCPPGQSGLCNPLKAHSITGLLNDILSYLVKIGTVFIVLMLVFVGFKFVAARGNSGDLEKARTMLLWTIIGALVILGAQAISMGVASTISAISQTP